MLIIHILLNKYALEKEIIFKDYGLVDIETPAGNWIRKYLNGRNQYNMNTFAWDPKYSRLFIFNLTKENKVLGFQVRNFKNSAIKYVTHTLEMIYKKHEIEIPISDEFSEVNRLSFLFGMNTTDFGQSIIVTEGPLDSFLIPNGMSVCGTNNDFPFELDNILWLYDSDDSGNKKAIERLSNGEYVFLWKKYIKDLGLNVFTTKIDYTDIVKFAKVQKKNLLPLRDYFSNNKYDIYYV
jgi:hypothetical protein